VKRAVLPLLVPLLAVAALAGCRGGGGGGGSKHTQTTTTVPDPASAMKALANQDHSLRGTVRTLYETATWAVVESAGKQKATAFAFHLVGGKWVADRSGSVKLEIVGPRAGGTTTAKPQVEIRFTTPSASVESALWIDGSELVERGGGTPTRGTISGTPLHALQPGTHVAVGYARSRSHGAAVAWVFSVG
jgi:hypothetical protein